MLSEKMEILNTELLKNHRIDKELYEKYDVKRGLRDSNGKGVLTGLTEVSDVCATDSVAGMTVPADGKLYYQGYNVSELIERYGNNKYCFEITVYLLLFGKIPSDDELELFLDVMWQMQNLENRFIRDVVMKASNSNIMNAMQRCVLTLYTYDEKPDDISPENVLRQSLELINKIPLIAVYGYKAYCHFRRDETLLIRNPEVGYSMAENILLMLRPDGKYTELEAKVLSIALILHAEHGGGNNSTFTCRVLTSSGTDPYSTYSAAIGSLKGPRHGGANHKVLEMQELIKSNVKNWENDDEIAEVLGKILRKEIGDGRGLIYGMGHAVYTLSDPRAVILKKYAGEIATGTEFEKEFKLLEAVERLTPAVFESIKKSGKTMCANIDMYSGFVYKMLGIPDDLFTPLFAVSRIAGWCAHRFEEINSGKRIMRPAYKSIAREKEYVDISNR